MAAKATSSIQVIARVSRLLDSLAAHDGPLNLKALADATGLHPSTAFRILASLIEHGFVERSTAGHYWLGAKLLRLGNRVRGQLDLRREARSVMERLRDRTGEAVNLSVREGDEVVYVERVTTPRIMRVEQVIGGRAPLHVTAAGKLFLADDGVEACRDYIERTGLPARTPYSIADPDRLCQSVRDISHQGFALDDQEAELGVGCIGTPIRDASGRLVAGLSVSAPIERRRDAWIPWVLQAAAEISARLGHCPPPVACIEAGQTLFQASSLG